MFQRVEMSYADTGAITLLDSGMVLLDSKYSVMLFDPSRPQWQRQLYGRQVQECGRLASASASALLPDGRSVHGGWHGELFLNDAGVLKTLSDKTTPPRGRLRQLLVWNDLLLVAGKGLWVYTVADLSPLSEVQALSSQSVHAMTVNAAGHLLVASDRALWRWRPGKPIENWKADLPQTGRINFLLSASDASIWLAANKGLFHFDASGQLLESLLDGVWTTAIVELDDELWVGTWKQGLLLRSQGRWFQYSTLNGLADPSVSGFAVDSSGTAWVGLYGEAAWRGPIQKLREQTLKSPYVLKPD